MKNTKGLLIGLVVIIAVVAGGILAISGKNNTKNDTTNMNMGDTNTKSANNEATNTNNAGTSSSVAVDAVAIENFKFAPDTIKVKVGTKVTWTNNDSVSHSVVADTTSESAPNGPLFGKGETYSFTFTKAGTYTYHCSAHPSMHGTVIVE